MRRLTAMIGVLALVLLFTQTLASAQGLGSKVYWMATIGVPIGKLAEYHAFAEKELEPLQAKHGYKFVATWQTIVGDIEEVIVVAEFDSMSAYHKARRSLLGSEEWRARSPKFNALVRSVKSRFLSATPYSKMQ